MFNKIISVSWILIFFVALIWSSPVPPNSQPHFQFNTTTHNVHHSNASGSSIAELVKKQAETVKKIVSNQQANAFGNYHQQPQPQPKPTVQPEKFTLEELKIKCQHLSRLAASANSTKSTTQTPQNTPTVRPTSGFYITTKPTTITARKPSSTPPSTRKPVQNVKFIKLEPVILQKTVLNDGRTIYYWLRSLPSAVQINPNLPTTTPQPTTTPSTTTSTTTTAQSGLNFRNFFPSFYPIGSAEPPSSSTTEKTTTTTPTPTIDPTSTSEIDKNNELIYQQQLKFVVPVPFSSANDEHVKKPWELDPFAYYPKPLQPETINVQVPYVPTFHVIKAVALPDQYDIPKNDEYPPLDHVNVQLD